MFKKSDYKGDRNHKQESGDHSAKAEASGEKPAPAPEKQSSPANEEKKS